MTYWVESYGQLYLLGMNVSRCSPKNLSPRPSCPSMVKAVAKSAALWALTAA